MLYTYVIEFLDFYLLFLHQNIMRKIFKCDSTHKKKYKKTCMKNILLPGLKSDYFIHYSLKSLTLKT